MIIYKTLSDNDLLHLLKKDDEHAFAELYRRYAENLVGFAAAKLFSLDDARDLIHDLFVRFWEERQTLQVTDHVKAFLFTLTRRRIIDKIRKNVTRQQYATFRQAQQEHYQDTVEQKLALVDLEQNIQKSLKELTPRVREIYLLSREEQLSITDIANRLDLSEQTVKNQLSTAIQHLRKTLDVIPAVLLLIRIISD